ncbi:MAG: primase-helicase zinc-binding domain-containing protein [Thermodesulfobacteriota bacterium]
MDILSAAAECGVRPKKVTGDEYASACPMCGGQDRFRIWPRESKGGRFWCRGCEKKGDAVQLFMDVKGWDFKTAARHMGRELQPQNHRYVKKRQTKDPVFKPREYKSPAEQWKAAAAAFMKYAHKNLLEDKAQLAYLAGRGIPLEAVLRFCLGYNPKDIFTDRARWGQPETGKKLFLPEGIVIPAFSLNNSPSLYRLRLRRPDPEAKPRYYMVPGSNPQTYAIAPQGLEPGYGWVIVEAELDAIAVSHAVGDCVGVLALGSVSMKPPAEALPQIKAAGVLLNALDFDEAGKKAHRWWVKIFPQTKRYPVPRGKDPGEYFKAGGDIRKWIMAGLPPGCRPEYMQKTETSDEAPTETAGHKHLSGYSGEVEGSEIYDDFLMHFISYMAVHLDGIEVEHLMVWIKTEAPKLYKEERRLWHAMDAYYRQDYKKYMRAVIDYTNHVGAAAPAYRKAGAAAPKEPELRQGELI